jgi:histone deacetylase 6
MTGLVYDDRFLLHRAPYEHPEHPGRLQAIRDHLIAEGLFERCRRVEAREATLEELEAIHTRALIDTVRATSARDFTQLDPDTYACRDSAEAAWLAAGGVADLTMRVVRGELDNGLALPRPPGHHAEADLAMGFCPLQQCRDRRAAPGRGISRILIVDWDGTTATARSIPSGTTRPSSICHSPVSVYPGTGAADELGGARARGCTVNVPWPAGMGDAEYLAAFDRVLMPIAASFRPELVLVSCGFDAAQGDLLGEMRVTPGGFAAMTARLQSLAGGRCVLVLEGGYNLEAISRSAAACLRVLLGENPAPERSGSPGAAGSAVIESVLAAQRPFWPDLRST